MQMDVEAARAVRQSMIESPTSTVASARASRPPPEVDEAGRIGFSGIGAVSADHE